MRSRTAAVVLLAATLAAALAACDKTDSGSAAPSPAASASADVAAAPPASASATEAAEEAPEDAGSDAAVLPGTSEGCPDDMVLAHGNYCENVSQVCLEYHEEYANDQAKKKRLADKGKPVPTSTVSERCMQYKEPSECLSKERTPLRFCVDRYEYPNKKGELPALLVSWTDAKKTCEDAGKRLCTEDEFNFACEGEEMLPYTYGYNRDPEVCSMDKPYRKRERKLYKYERCMKDPRCKAELEKLDQRLPAGSLPGCVSPFGAYDMNGNINEWVSFPGHKYPDRSGLKGGWWGPVRNRCRPTVGFHKEEDYGYEAGFRCCKDAEPAP